MEEARKIDLRPLLAVGAVVALAAVMMLWAAGAFAAGGSSSSNDPSGDAAWALIQSEEEGQGPSREDCPKDRGGPGGAGPSDGNGAPEGNSDGSGSPHL